MNKLRCARCQELKFGEQLSHSNAHRSVSRNFVNSLCYPQPLYSGCKEELENSRISLFADTVQSRADTLGSLLEAAQVNVGFGLGLGPWTMAINMAISTKYGPFMALFSPKYGS